MSNLMFHAEKLGRTLRLAFTLVMARTFGRYIHSGWNGQHNYASYEWRGRVWLIPTSPVAPTPPEGGER